jgi:hypothetical protein
VSNHLTFRTWKRRVIKHHAFKTTALDGCKLLASSSFLGIAAVTLCIGGWVGSGAVMDFVFQRNTLGVSEKCPWCLRELPLVSQRNALGVSEKYPWCLREIPLVSQRYPWCLREMPLVSQRNTLGVADIPVPPPRMEPLCPART